MMLMPLLMQSIESPHLPTPTAAGAESSQHFAGSDHHLMIRPMDS